MARLTPTVSLDALPPKVLGRAVLRENDFKASMGQDSTLSDGSRSFRRAGLASSTSVGSHLARARLHVRTLPQAVLPQVTLLDCHALIRE
jgi:hypothetical protein